MSKPNQRGKGMKPKIKTISPEELKNFLEKEALLFTSKDLAKMQRDKAQEQRPMNHQKDQDSLVKVLQD